MTASYLSIDLDYWNEETERQMLNFLKKVMALDIPINAYIEHHEILRSVNRAKFDTLFNVDYHSDLCEDSVHGQSPLELNEGTWGNFVKGKKDKTFIWIHPQTTCYINPGSSYEDHRGDGRCDLAKNPFTNPQAVCGWKDAKHRTAKLPTQEEMNTVQYIGLCVSPDWTDVEIVKSALRLLYNENAVSEYFMRKALAAFNITRKECYA